MPVPRLAATILLDQHRHRYFQTFVSGKTTLTGITGTAPPGYGEFLVEAGVNHPVFEMTAIWTFHFFTILVIRKKTLPTRYPTGTSTQLDKGDTGLGH